MGFCSMHDDYENARELFFEAIRALATSSNSIQDRLTVAFRSIVFVTIDEFQDDVEMKLKFARLLDALAVDNDDIEIAGAETAAHMSDHQASIAADLICDFFYDLG